jgi:hypothetical protein
MAKIYTETIVITLNKLVKDNAAPAEIATNNVLTSLVSVVEELAGAGVVVEVERA